MGSENLERVRAEEAYRRSVREELQETRRRRESQEFSPLAAAIGISLGFAVLVAIKVLLDMILR